MIVSQRHPRQDQHDNEFTGGSASGQGTGEPSAPSTEVAGLYLHVPFCFHKCHYCDFYSIVDSQGRQGEFTDALIRELGAWAGRQPLRPRTVFVGGGTPTLLETRHWRKLLAAMRAMGLMEAVTEFTVEANPETVTPALLETLAEGGVNRLSIGAQSFNRDLLKTLERWHEPDSVNGAVKAARRAGIEDINLDLIFAVPGQTVDMLDRDLDALLNLDPTHLACYSLIFEPGTPLTQKQQLGRITPIEEDLESTMYQRVIDRLDAAGFEHYEISNWAKAVSPYSTGVDLGRCSSLSPTPADARDRPTDTRDPKPDNRNHRCDHNLIYWHNDNWLGIGPSAASHLAGRRWKNAPHLGKYLQQSPAPPLAEDERLGPDQQIGEVLMLGLRLREGVALNWLDRSLNEDDRRWDAIEQMQTLGMLETTASHLRLTHRGLFLADRVIGELL